MPGLITPRSALACLLALAVAAGCGGPAPEQAEAPAPLQFEAVPAGASLAVRGERLGRVLGCRGCHGQDLTGQPWIEDPAVAILFTSNLTRVVPGYSDSELARTIRLGERPDGSVLWDMPSDIFTRLSGPDMSAIIAWLRTLPPAGAAHPRIAVGPEGRRAISRGEIRPATEVARAHLDKGPVKLDGRHDWARYMIRATCGECHGIEIAGSPSTPDHPGPPDLVVAAGYSRDQFRHLLRTGEPIGGRRLNLMADVARGRFVHLTDREVDAIYDYLVARASRPQ